MFWFFEGSQPQKVLILETFLPVNGENCYKVWGVYSYLPRYKVCLYVKSVYWWSIQGNDWIMYELTLANICQTKETIF